MKRVYIIILSLFFVTMIYAMDKPKITIESNGYEQMEKETKYFLQEYGYMIVDENADYTIIITNYFLVKGGIIVNFAIKDCLTSKITKKSVSCVGEESIKGKNISKKIIEFIFQEKYYSKK